ncbi:MAG: hypothetical protein EBU49_00370 [Proteobacteria bacterium]|nr:hypothetical protein [Pseudomonadota bacterium]
MNRSLEILSAGIFLTLILVGLAAAASAAQQDDGLVRAAPTLPVRVSVPSSDAGATTGWDIDGDGIADMIQVVEHGAAPAGARVDTAYDFDGDGKPDLIRTNGAATRPDKH